MAEELDLPMQYANIRQGRRANQPGKESVSNESSGSVGSVRDSARNCWNCSCCCSVGCIIGTTGCGSWRNGLSLPVLDGVAMTDGVAKDCDIKPSSLDGVRYRVLLKQSKRTNKQPGTHTHTCTRARAREHTHTHTHKQYRNVHSVAVSVHQSNVHLPS